MLLPASNSENYLNEIKQLPYRTDASLKEELVFLTNLTFIQSSKENEGVLR